MPPTVAHNAARGVSTSLDAQTAAAELFAQIGHVEAALVAFHCSTDYDLPALAAALRDQFGETELIGCTTAGEITPRGYIDQSLVGIALPRSSFTAAAACIDNVAAHDLTDGRPVTRELLQRISATGVQPDGQNTFGYLLIDGVSRKEDVVVGSLYRHLGDIQLMGGSAAQGLKFEQTWVYYDGTFAQDRAVFALVQTDLPFTVFKTQHFQPTDSKFVVTSADPAERVVFEINGEPAAREYARLVDIQVDDLSEMVFAAHPVVVRLGGNVFVRSIMKVNEDLSLTFACAIESGVVLTVARGVDMVANLEEAFAAVRERLGPPQFVLGCDCLLRVVEMDQKQLRGAISELMVANNVVGFSTYGEQFNAMHVNQTFTGVAIGRAQK